MKRSLVSCCVVIALGAALNVAIAWWAAARTDVFTFEHRWGQIQDDSSELAFFVTLREHPLRTRVFSHAPRKRHEYQVVAADNFPYWSAARGVANAWPEAMRNSAAPCAEDASGWPFRALRYRVLSVEKDGLTALIPFHGTYFAPAETKAGISLADHPGPSGWSGNGPYDEKWLLRRALPIEPVLLGFTANTMLYAMGFATLYLMAHRLILLTPWFRNRRGLCRRCAYDLRFDFDRGCPECGWNRDSR